MKERGCLSRTGPNGEELYSVDGSIHIGSRDCDVTVKDAAPRQVQIVKTAEGFLVIDLTGQKVTKVNGTRVERHLLKEGETLTVGSSEFKWSVTVEIQEAVPAEPVFHRTTRKIPRASTASIPKVKPPSRSRVIVIAAAAAAAVLVVIILIVVFSSSSNADRN